MSIALRHDATLRSRSLVDGTYRTVRVAVPRAPRSVGVSTDPDIENRPLPKLFIAGNTGYVTGSWCTEQANEDESCTRGTAFFARFDLRTGQVLARSLTSRPRVLVAGSRVTEVVPRKGRDSLLKDAATRKVVRAIPRRAYDVQGGADLLTWKSGGNGDDPTDWDRMRFFYRDSGRELSTLTQRDVERATGTRTTLVQSIDVQPDGTSVMFADFDAPAWPAFIDERGRALRLGRRLQNANTFLTVPTTDRVGLFAGSNSDRRTRCDTVNSWLVDRAGRTGFDLDRLPTTPGHKRDSIPTFADGTTLVWSETSTNVARPSDPRTRAAFNYHRLPLTTSDAPRC
jgi:hypothetical protein